MGDIATIKRPIDGELQEFIRLFEASLSNHDGMLGDVLSHILKSGGKYMRPMLVLLVAKNYSEVSSVTLNGAIGLELLHTASLVHDDVVDESAERRGQPSANALFNNKVSILVGDYILSTALFYVSLTNNTRMVRYLAELGRTLSHGEIDQLANLSSKDISEEEYFKVIRMKTAALFSACAKIGALSADATEQESTEAEAFGDTLGTIFQIRDDIFDYYPSGNIGKPTGNDMAEGKLTLPVIHAVSASGNKEMEQLALAVRARTISTENIARLVEFTKQQGGIAYAEQKMEELKGKALQYIEKCRNEEIKSALRAYLDYIIERSY